MSLADLDRPPITWHYARWDRDVTFRQLSARQLMALSGLRHQVDGQPADLSAALTFYAAMLAAMVIDPQYDEEAWLDTTTATLTELGLEALKINGMMAGETKKN